MKIFYHNNKPFVRVIQDWDLNTTAVEGWQKYPLTIGLDTDEGDRYLPDEVTLHKYLESGIGQTLLNPIVDGHNLELISNYMIGRLEIGSS